MIQQSTRPLILYLYFNIIHPFLFHDQMWIINQAINLKTVNLSIF